MLRESTTKITMKITWYKTYICCDAVELLPNGEEAARRAIQWNITSASPADLLSILNKLWWTIRSKHMLRYVTLRNDKKRTGCLWSTPPVSQYIHNTICLLCWQIRVLDPRSRTNYFFDGVFSPEASNQEVSVLHLILFEIPYLFDAALE